MSEIGDTWRAIKEDRQIASSKWVELAPKLLEDKGIPFTSHNNGQHLILEDVYGSKIDYWPSTGRWSPRVGKSGKGFKELIEYLS